MLVRLLVFAVILGSVAAPSDVLAHIQLARPFKPRYELRTITCAACHDKEQKEKSRDALTDLGKDLAKLLEGKRISERIEEAKDFSGDERKEFFETIEKETIEALEKLDKMKAPNGKLYAEALPAGDLDGTKPR